MICVCSSNTHTPPWVVVHRACIWQYLARSTTRPLSFTAFLLSTRINLQTSNLAQSLISDVFLCFFLFLLLLFFWKGCDERGQKKPCQKSSTGLEPIKVAFFPGIVTAATLTALFFFDSGSAFSSFLNDQCTVFCLFVSFFSAVKGDSWIIMF